MRRITRRMIGNLSFSAIVLCGSIVPEGWSLLTETFVPHQVRAQELPPKPGITDAGNDSAGKKTASQNQPAKAKSVEDNATKNRPDAKNGAPTNSGKKPAGPDIVQSVPAQQPMPKLSERQMAMLKQTGVERQRIFRESLENATTSIRESKDSFDRGLMPLSEFVDQATAALEIQIAVSDLTSDRSGRIRALADHSELLKTAARQMQVFNQPAAQGWAADTAYLQLLTANTELRLAVARGDQGGYARAAEAGKKLSDEYYTLRLNDFRNGQASLSQLSRAASYLTTDPGLPAGSRNSEAGPTKYEEYLAALDDVVDQTQKFAEQGAGIGREDRLFQAAFELAKAEGQAALQKRRPAEAAAAFGQAIDSSIDWYQSELKFYESGTASLRDVTQAWWARAELGDISERAGLIEDEQTQKNQQADFQQLEKLAANTQDRRGRIAADITYVKTLGNLEGLWTRQRAIQAMAAVNNGASTRPPVSGGVKVIDIKNPTNSKPPAPSGASTKGVQGATPTQVDKSKSSPVEIVTPKRNPN